jgi:putative membrane protein
MLDVDRAAVIARSESGWWLLVAVAVLGLVWSGVQPRDQATWALEVFPVVIALPLLHFTRKTFPLTALLYILIALHASILMVGGHYTYALVPAGDWLRELLGLARNPYDRLGHFAQGFVPALIAREVLLRKTPLHRGAWLFFVVTCICMAVSVCYEFLEWWTAVIIGGKADDFLGTQGDVWDTQWDMFVATCGAIIAQLLLARTQDRQLAAGAAPTLR